MLKVDYEAIREHSSDIKEHGHAYTEVSFPTLEGSDSNGCSDGNDLAARLASFLKQSRDIAETDSKNIALLASCFQEKDEEITRGMA